MIYLSPHAIYILSALYDLIFATKCLNAWETCSFLRALITYCSYLKGALVMIKERNNLGLSQGPPRVTLG